MKTKVAGWAVAALVGALAALVAPAVVAEDQDPVAEVVHGHRAPVKVTGDGAARAAPMARGRTAVLAEFSLEAGAQFDPEPRSEEQYLYAFRGSAVLNVDDRRYLVGPRTGVYVPAGADPRWTNGSEEFVAVQVFAGTTPVEGFENWRGPVEQNDWPRPDIWPSPEPSEISGL